MTDCHACWGFQTVLKEASKMPLNGRFKTGATVN